MVLDLEGNAAGQELVHHHSQRPNVHLPVVTVPQQQLRRNVERGAAESVPILGGGVDRPSEVSDFGNAERQHDVFGFEIAVYHSVPVQFEKSLADALH